MRFSACKVLLKPIIISCNRNNTSRWYPLVDWEIISSSYAMLVPLFDTAYMIDEILFLLAMDWAYYVLVLIASIECG
jgi:hypothetical protein